MRERTARRRALREVREDRPSSCASTAFRSRKSLSAIRTSGTAGVASDTTSTRWFWRRSALLVKTADRTWWRPFRALDGIDVIHVDLGPDPNHEKDALAWLDRAETERLRRFRIARPRREFALCRAALRINLCNRLDCTNHRLSFGFHEHGKPFALVEGRAASISFNVSHSAPHGLIAFASQGRPRGRIGIDVEVLRADRDFDGIAGTVFGAQERAALAAAWGDDKVRLFYRLWTLKEALIKALGTGFSLAPARFEIPAAMVHEVDSGGFRFPHVPADRWRLICLPDTRFAAAIACKIDPDGR